MLGNELEGVVFADLGHKWSRNLLLLQHLKVNISEPRVLFEFLSSVKS
jgi:hypothetical protein